MRHIFNLTKYFCYSSVQQLVNKKKYDGATKRSTFRPAAQLPPRMNWKHPLIARLRTHAVPVPFLIALLTGLWCYLVFCTCTELNCWTGSSEGSVSAPESWLCSWREGSSPGWAGTGKCELKISVCEPNSFTHVLVLYLTPMETTMGPLMIHQ